MRYMATALAGRTATTEATDLNLPTEKLIRKILVPTDFSPASMKAIERAVALANQCDAVVTLLHVINLNGQADTGSGQELMKRLWNEGSAQMAQLAWSLSGKVEAQTMLEQGLVWEAIVEQSKGSDLLILCKDRRKSGLKFFGKHTAEQVIEHANCPVMVVHQD